MKTGTARSIAADIAELSRIFADDYVQYDEFGEPSDETRRNEQVSRPVHPLPLDGVHGPPDSAAQQELAIVHGSEEDDVEQGGRRFPVRYIYMDVVVKRDGGWQIVGRSWRRMVSELSVTDG